MTIQFKVKKDYDKFIFKDYSITFQNKLKYNNFVVEYIEGNCQRESVKTRNIYKIVNYYKKVGDLK